MSSQNGSTSLSNVMFVFIVLQSTFISICDQKEEGNEDGKDSSPHK